jgi:hypothetical protein
MVVVRGVNVYPSAIEAVVRQFPEVIEFMVEQKKVGAMDEIELLIEAPGVVPERLLSLIEARLRDTFYSASPCILWRTAAFLAMSLKRSAGVESDAALIQHRIHKSLFKFACL